MSDIAKLSRGIAAGETFEYDGSIEVESIGKGATVNIKNGGIRVKGDVDDGATITVRGQSLSNHFTMSSNGGSMTISNISVGRNVTIINGVVVSGDMQQQGMAPQNELSGRLIIDGKTGDNVTLKSNGSINFQHAGNVLTADGDGTIEFKTAGKEFIGNAGGTIKAQYIGSRSEAKAGGTVDIGEIGDGAEVKAGGMAQIGIAGLGCVVKAGGMANVAKAGKNTHVKAGGMANVSLAHTSAIVKAGGMTNVGSRSSNDDDFKLSPATPPQNKL